jgi:hypothetical protein
MGKLHTKTLKPQGGIQGMLGHCVGAACCVAMLALLAGGEGRGDEVGPVTRAFDYEIMSPADCKATFDVVLRQARATGRHAWIWTDESRVGHGRLDPGAGLPPPRVAEGVAGGTGFGASMQAPVYAPTFVEVRAAYPTANRPAPTAIASDAVDTRPEGACRFMVNRLRTQPKA